MLQIARQLFRHRGLLATLTVRELKARYRGSVLGFLWSLVNPLLLLGVYSLVFGRILNPRFATTEPYVAFLVAGLFPWIWISSSILEGTQSLTANASLIRKAVFPIELLPCVSVLSNLVHFLLALPIVFVPVVVGRIYGYPIGGYSMLLLPVLVLLQLVLITGVVLALSALNVHFKDVRDLVSNLLTLLFFLAPIIYTIEQIPYPAIATAIQLNPMTPFVTTFQALLFFGRLPSPLEWATLVGIAFGAWILGAWLFGRLNETLVEAV